MGDRKWEDLPVDCLVNIFGRVGLESLVEGVPYVCKSWFKASLSHLCWQSLIIPSNLPGSPNDNKLAGFSGENSVAELTSMVWLFSWLQRFLKFVIRRSNGSANVVALTDISLLSNRTQVLNEIAEGCPLLKKLVLPFVFLCDNPYPNLPSLICKWKELEALEIGGGYLLEDVISQLSAHCKNFVSLSISNAKIGESVASSIATLLPNVEYLCLRKSKIQQSSVLMILREYKKLVYFDAGIFMGFDVDEEIKNLASSIMTFKFEVSELDYDTVEEDDEYDEFQWQL